MKPLSTIQSPPISPGQIENKSPYSSPFRTTGRWQIVAQKIWMVASAIFKTCLGIFLYRLNPVLFAIGFITGIIADEKVKGSIKKITDLWQEQSRPIKAFTIFATFLSMPVTLGTATLIFSSYYGSKISLKAQQRSFRG